MSRKMYRKNDYTRAHSQKSLNDPYRSPFRRDYARLLHSAAFRRLQGKTQLFPGTESDFFRNRLTHSLEVAQVAKSIALKLNTSELELKNTISSIDTDLIETAALAHDLGHPPFGHNGEEALDDCMKNYGGFEGNAQTLRILARLEKKAQSDDNPLGVDEKGKDLRLGLDLCHRTLAAVLKYDKAIPNTRKYGAALVKGYYQSESGLVDAIKNNVAGSGYKGKFKTIECQIMDIADDIAYSTYDLEDTLKAGFSNLLDMAAPASTLLENIAAKVRHTLSTSGSTKKFESTDAASTLFEIISQQDSFALSKLQLDLPSSAVQDADLENQEFVAFFVGALYKSTLNLGQNGYLRTNFTSALVNNFIHGVRFEYNKEIPALSRVYLDEPILIQVEVLKHFTFESQIMSPRLKVVHYRGYGIVKDLFDALVSDDGYKLMPDDFSALYQKFKDEGDKKRLVCDFIAGMTDRYAIEFYSRLKSENAQTIFKPI